MSPIVVALASLVAGILGAALGYLLQISRAAALSERAALAEQAAQAARVALTTAQAQHTSLVAADAALRKELELTRQSSEEKLRLLTEASEALSRSFSALSAEALDKNSHSFLLLAQETLGRFQQKAQGELEKREQAVANLVKPIHDSLGKVDAQIQLMEKGRAEAYGSLAMHVQVLAQSHQSLQVETRNLVTALRAPHVRGRWGEIQLKRVVEMAGMVAYCDFIEQSTAATADGKLRPDLVVKLPGGKNVVVDAKTPLAAYLEAMEAKDDELRRARLADHARQTREHLAKLSAKSYLDQFQPSPEFVVMFLPGETFFSAALEHDPALIEEGVAQRVIPASPTTLIALLRAVAYGWRQEKIAESAQQISQLGSELYGRLCTFASHLESVGKSLDKSVDCYNKAVASLESRVMPAARKFPELGTPVKEDLPQLEPVERTVRAVAGALGEGEAKKAADS